MASKGFLFLSKALGSDFMESLAKSELWKPGTRTVVDPEEIRTALKIVPRTIMAILVKELVPMSVGETKEITLPIPTNRQGGGTIGEQEPTVSRPPMILITKLERDVYSGHIVEVNKKVVDFLNRSLPAVGLVIMSAFELYDVYKINEPAPEEAHDDVSDKVERIIKERLALQAMIEQVVENKISQRDAQGQYFLDKITQAMAENDKANKQIVEITKVAEGFDPNPSEYHRGMINGLKVAEACVTKEEPTFLDYKKKPKPLQKFLDERKKKLAKNEFAIQMIKGEQVHCPDCRKNIFDGAIYSGCLCLGLDMDKKLFINKTETGVKVRFGAGWDSENMEMLLEVLRKKRE